ncbi:MAG: hypothetical protein VX519_01230 [Myxococcota bacterium]|nr:hypothetical protein [Myxococcota bacterium]
MSLPGMEQALLHLFMATAFAQAPTPDQFESTLADRVVSVVGDTIITLSELELEKTIAEHDSSSIPAFNHQDPLLRLEDFRILRSLAGDVPLYVPDRLTIDNRMARFRSTWPGEKAYLVFLHEQGLQEQDLRSLMRSRVMAEAYVERNVGLALRAEHDPASPEWEAHYQSTYETWMSERRKEAGIRRIPERPTP